MKIGAQMYTVREYCKTLEDFENTLKKLAEIGFKYVQVSGVCEYRPEWLADKLKKYGLKCIITHTNQAKLIEDPQKTADAHSVFGCDYIGMGSMPNLFNYSTVSDEEVPAKFFENSRNVMKVLRENGKLLMYHNHGAEFIKYKNGKNMMDLLCEGTSADEMGFTLDMYWVQYGGHNPVDMINKLSGRIPCVHFKDYKIARDKENPVRMAVVGEGNLDWDAIIPACEKSGVKYAFIEQDNTYGEDPFDCLKRSFDYLVSKGLEIE